MRIKKHEIRKKYYYYRAVFFRWNRLLFPSAAELRFMEIMGAKMLQIKWIKHPETKRHFVLVRSLGKALSAENFEREVRAGRYWLDFGNDILWCIEVDGKAYHRDIVKEQVREEYLTGFCDKKCSYYCIKHSNKGYRVKHIPALRLWLEPAVVQSEVLRFLSV